MIYKQYYLLSIKYSKILNIKYINYSNKNELISKINSLIIINNNLLKYKLLEMDKDINNKKHSKDTAEYLLNLKSLYFDLNKIKEK